MSPSKRLRQLRCHFQSRHISSSPPSSSNLGSSNGPAIAVSTSAIPNANGKVAFITVSNPTKLNIVDSELLVKLEDVFSSLSAQPDLRAVVLTGATMPSKSPSFIGGADINEMSSLGSPSEARAFIIKIHQVCNAIRSLPVPVIARVHGYALGAGLEIMTACDLKVATAGSTFAMPEVKVGIPSVAEARLLPDLIGWGRARRLLLLAETIGAVEALKWGLIDAIAGSSADELDAKVDEWVLRIAENGPKAVRSQKDLIRKWEEGGVQAGIEAGIDAFAAAWEDGGSEPKELMNSFRNRKR